MRLGLTTEGAETPVRAARKEACERIRFAQLGRNSPTLDGRQMICGRGVDEWHEVRLPPSSFRAPRSGFPRFQWLTDLSTAPRIKCAPSPDRGIDNSALSAQMDLTLFVYTLLKQYSLYLSWRRGFQPRCPLNVLAYNLTIAPAMKCRERSKPVGRGLRPRRNAKPTNLRCEIVADRPECDPYQTVSCHNISSPHL